MVPFLYNIIKLITLKWQFIKDLYAIRCSKKKFWSENRKNKIDSSQYQHYELTFDWNALPKFWWALQKRNSFFFRNTLVCKYVSTCKNFLEKSANTIKTLNQPQGAIDLLFFKTRYHKRRANCPRRAIDQRPSKCIEL